MKRGAVPKPAALLIAGGSGTRFWPSSRVARPKPFFSVDGQRTLLAETILRLHPLIPRNRIFVLAAASHARAFRDELRRLIPARNLIIEPAARGTAVAIAYGATVLKKRLGKTILTVMPVDHVIRPAAGFRSTIRDAVAMAASRDAIVVIGVPPRHPETGFGYQKIGSTVGRGFVVDRFVEKPDAATAQRMVRSGSYLWNAGIFVMSTETLDAEMRRVCRPLASAISAIAAKPLRAIKRAYMRLTFDSFDREVVEKSKQVLGVRARFTWHDVGSWEGLHRALARDHHANLERGMVLALDSSGTVAHAGQRLMVLFGVDDIVVVDTDDALLVTTRSRSHELRRVVEELNRRRLHRFL